MAVTRRGYIFSAFLLSIVCVLFIIISISSDSWIVSTATVPEANNNVSAPTPQSSLASSFRYGMFGGELQLYNLATPTFDTLYMICLPDVSACAVTCKTDATAREEEVRAMAQGLRPNLGCVAVTVVDTITPPLEVPPVISFGVYVCVLLFLFLQLLTAVIAAALAIINATMNPTEPMFGLPGCLWTNGVTALLGLVVMMLFGIYWATSGLNEHLAFSFIVLEFFVAGPSLGYSYWLLLGAILCSLTNIGLIQLRAYLLERDPPPPTIKVENHSDGTIFLY